MEELISITRRKYLTIKMMQRGYDFFTCTEAVSSSALAHPEWDMEEKKTWYEWEEQKDE
jgi:hypothetical protein